MARKVTLQYQIKKFENQVLRPIKDKQYWIMQKRWSPEAFGYSQEQRISTCLQPWSGIRRLQRSMLVPILVYALYLIKKVGMFNRLNQLSGCFDLDCRCALKVYSSISKSVIITWEKPVYITPVPEENIEFVRQRFSQHNCIHHRPFMST